MVRCWPRTQIASNCSSKRAGAWSTLCKRYYEEDDESVLPRNIASFGAFENAVSLDIAMGGSTNTVLHLLAAAHEAGVDFTMADIDRLSRRVPCLSKVAPAKSDVHMEDVHRAGGIMAILGELERAGLLHTESAHGPQPDDGRRAWPSGTLRAATTPKCRSSSAPHRAACPRQTAFSQSRRWKELDLDREKGVIRSAEHAFSKDGGLAVLYGNLARMAAS